MVECASSSLSFSCLDPFFRAQAETVFSVFTHYTTGVLLFFALLLLAIGSTCRAILKSRAANRQLKQASNVLLNAKDAKDFTQQFDVIDASFKQNSLLKRHWEEYTETMIPPLEGVDDNSYQVFRNTKRPQEFFTAEAVLHDVRPWVDGERLIGFGLLFTFIGLIAALSKASGAFNGDENITIALATLLSTAGAKFLASIGGLSGSILQSLMSNKCISISIERLSHLNDMLEERLNYVSVERIAADQYGHAQRQTARLEQMGTEITMALGQQISDAMTNIPYLMGSEISKALEPMKDSLESVTSKMSENNTEALSNMVGEFRDQIQGAGEDSMKLVIDQLEGLSSALNTTVSGLQSSNDEMRSGLRDAINAMSSATSQFNDSISSSAKAASGQMDHMSETLGSTIQSLLSDFQEQQASSQASMRELIGTLSQSSNKASQELAQQATASSHQLGESVTTALNDILSNATHNTEAIAGTVKEGLSKVSEHAQTELRSLLQQLGEEIKQSVAGVNQSLDGWKESSGRVASSLNQVNSELGKTSTGIVTTTERIHDVSSVFKGAAASVETATSPLLRISEKLNATMEAMESVNRNTVKSVDLLSSSVKSSVEETSRAVAELRNTWERQASHLKGVDKELEGAFNTITGQLTRSLETLQSFSSELGDQMGKVTDDFASIVGELSDALEGFNAKRK